MTRYDLAYLAIAPAAGALVGYKYWAQGKYQESLPAILGRTLDTEDRTPWQEGSIWVHAVSVGEVIAAKAMLPLLKESYPQWPILLTTHTETGQAQARQLEGTLARAVRYFPFDLSWVVSRFIDVYRPRMFVAMETELWPNVLNLVHAAGARSFVLNGKISERSFRSYARVRPLLQQPLSTITAYCMQTEADAQRIRGLAGTGTPVHVTGNCKFDAPVPEVSAAHATELRDRFGVAETQQVVVVGSTHPGEEEIVLAAWQQVRARFPSAVMLLAPRHPERFDAVWSILKASGLPARRASNGESSGIGAPSILLIDQMGVLAQLYALANVAVVAGSFVDGIGGHNLQEAAGHGVPVIYGTYMRKQPDMTRILSPENGGTVADSPGALAQSIGSLLSDPALAQEKGALGRAAFLQNRGSAQRNLEIIRSYMQ
jgi:3-deoxy-D-manno-octulosonic-acid transferase